MFVLVFGTYKVCETIMCDVLSIMSGFYAVFPYVSVHHITELSLVVVQSKLLFSVLDLVKFFITSVGTCWAMNHGQFYWTCLPTSGDLVH